MFTLKAFTIRCYQLRTISKYSLIEFKTANLPFNLFGILTIFTLQGVIACITLRSIVYSFWDVSQVSGYQTILFAVTR
jgi:hypothetical protein